MKTSLLRAALLVSVFVGVPLACSSGNGESSTARLVPEGEAPALPLDHPPVDMGEEKPAPRGAQRMNLEQLRASFDTALGPRPDGGSFAWMYGSRTGLDSFSRALGEADFITTVEDDLDSSPLYLKFMDDAARASCNSAISSDNAESAPNRRSLIRHVSFGQTVETHPEEVDANLRDLLLRFHGRRVPAGSPELEPIRALFSETFAGAREAGRSQIAATQDAWRAVCVTLLTAPEFHLY
jgi:hypothetical protein